MNIEKSDEPFVLGAKDTLWYETLKYLFSALLVSVTEHVMEDVKHSKRRNPDLLIFPSGPHEDKLRRMKQTV